MSTPVRVLGVVEGWIPTVRIALEQPLKYLEAQGEVCLTVKLAIEVDMLDIAANDLIIFQRCIYPYSLIALDYAKRLRKATMYDIDDNFFAFAPDTRMGELFNRPEIRSTICGHMAGCDRVKVSSPELYKEVSRVLTEAGVAKEDIKKRIIMHPFCVNTSLLDHEPAPSAHEGVVIGYAGTLGHGPDFEPVVPALHRILKEFPKTRLEFAGFQLPEFEVFGDRVTLRDFNHDYDAFFRDLYRWNWDIGLAPLRDTIANRSKTNNKYREYAVCGTVGIYSDLPVYDCVRDGETGLVVEHTEEGWYQALRRLVEDGEERAAMAEKARTHAKSAYDVPVIAALWRDEIFAQVPRQTLYDRENLMAFYQAAREAPIQFYGRQLMVRVKYLAKIKRFVKRILQTLRLWPKD